MTIRRALEGDAEAIAVLNEDVQVVHFGHMPDRFKRPNREDLIAEITSLFDQPQIFAFIAENEDGDPEGYALSTIRTRPETALTIAAKFVELDQVAVRAESRHTGVGRSLVSEVVALAKSVGAERVELSTWDFNEGAHQFLERLGFSSIFRRFSFALDKSSGDNDS